MAASIYGKPSKHGSLTFSEAPAAKPVIVQYFACVAVDGL